MATVLKRAGVSTEFIKETLGHNNLTTTENYLDSFELGIKKKYANHLLNRCNVLITLSAGKEVSISIANDSRL